MTNDVPNCCYILHEATDDDGTMFFVVSDTDGNDIATCDTKEEADLIARALSDYVSGNGLKSTRNRNIPTASSLLRSTEDALRRARQMYVDRALDGVSIYSSYTPCLRHADEQECSQHKSDINETTRCVYRIEYLTLRFPDNVKYRLDIKLIMD